MEPSCIFCRIIAGDGIQSWKVWEDELHVAFLTPSPNTPGFTVLATRRHLDSNILRLPDDEYQQLMRAGQTVALVLERAFTTNRIALVAEGMGVNHAHIKLIPLHGIDSGDWKPVTNDSLFFSEQYAGYITSQEGPRMEDALLDRYANDIRTANHR